MGFIPAVCRPVLPPFALIRVHSRLGTLLACAALFLLVAVVPAGAEALSIALTGFEEGAVPRVGGETVHPESRITLSREEAHSGRQSARLAYRFEKVAAPRQYVSWILNLPLRGRAEGLRAWIFGDGAGQSLRARVVDTSGEFHQFRGPVVDWRGWREVSIPFQDAETRWGGDGNGALDPPLRLETLLVDSLVEPAQGVLYLDDLSYLATGDPLEFVQVTFHSDRPGGVFWGKDAPRFRVEARNLLSDRAQDVELLLSAPPAGGHAAEEKRRLALPPGGAVTFDHRPRVSGYGLFQIRAAVSAAAARREATFTFARLRSHGGGKLDAESPFGACTHFAQGKGKLPLSLDLLAGMGGRWLRDEASWGAIEKQKGQYTFPPAFDAYLRAAPKHGIQPFVIFDYGNPLYDGGASPASREAISAFADYAYQLVRRYKDVCRFWEVYNEPNIGFWKPKPDPQAYSRLLRATYMAAKRADPTCTVVGICTAGTDLKYIEAVLKEDSLDYMDAVSIHPYRYPRAPEESDFVGELTRCKELVDRYGGQEKPLWLTEIGWPTQNDRRGVSEETSADYLVRMYVQAMSLPFVRQVFWYDFQNDGTDPAYNEHNFGLIRLDFTPKAGYIAYRMMTEALAGKRFVRRLSLPEPQYAYEFADGRERAVVAWCAKGSAGASLRVGDPAVDVSDARGRYERRETQDGVLTLELTGTPLFLAGRFASPEVLPPIVSGVSSGPVMPGEAAEVTVTLRNPYRTPLAPSLRLEAPAGWGVTLPAPEGAIAPGAEARVSFAVKVPAEAVRQAYALRAIVLDAEGRECGVGEVPVAVENPLHVSVWPTLGADGPRLGLRLRNRFGRALPALAVDVTLRPPGPPQRLGGSGGAEPATQPPQRLGGSGGAEPLAPQEIAVAPLGPGKAREYLYSIPVRDTGPTPDGPLGVTVSAQLPGGALLRSELAVNFWRVPRLGRVSVDGDLSEWAAVAPVQIGRVHRLREAHTGPDDQDARLRLATTPEALCLALEVTDDRHVQPFTGAEMWQGDCVQLAVDPSPVERRQAEPANAARQAPYTELGLSLGPNGPEVYRWRPEEGAVPGVFLRARREGNVTLYEAAIPWHVLGVVPAPGRALGFALIVNENDGDGRDGWLELFGGIGVSKDPLQFGWVVLE